MSANSSIEWTDATWNPVRGCDVVSPGCTNCYAMKQAHRFSGKGKAYDGLTKLTRGGPVWTGKIKLVPELIEEPLRWRKPRRIFVNSMSDLFHEDVPDSFIVDVFCIMARCPEHVFQVLTKRPARMLDFLSSTRNVANIRYKYDDEQYEWPLPNVWLGVSVEDQRHADERIPLLLQTTAAVRWVSAEPLLGPIDLYDSRYPYAEIVKGSAFAWGAGVRWVVAGGESGPGARPMHPDWVRSLRDQCTAAGAAFFFKQWGEFSPTVTVVNHADHRLEQRDMGGMVKVGKRKAGRLLDGREWNEYPA